MRITLPGVSLGVVVGVTACALALQLSALPSAPFRATPVAYDQPACSDRGAREIAKALADASEWSLVIPDADWFRRKSTGSQVYIPDTGRAEVFAPDQSITEPAVDFDPSCITQIDAAARRLKARVNAVARDTRNLPEETL